MAVPGLLYRWRADSIAQADGTAVASWEAKTGGVALGQTTAANQPTYHTAGIGGKPSVRFDGVDDILSGAITSRAQPVTIVAVTKSDVLPVSHRQLYHLGVEMMAHENDVWTGYAGAELYGGAVTVDPAVVTIIADGGSSVIYKDGTGATPGNLGTSGLGSTAYVGGHPSLSRPWDGDVAEILVYDHVLTADERSAVHSYVQDRYGITVSDYTANATPSANAGPDQIGLTPGVTVTLSGTDSDLDGLIETRQWTQTGGPAVTLTGATTATATFTAPSVTVGTTLTFSYTVTDDRGAVSSDSVAVLVEPDTPTGSTQTELVRSLLSSHVLTAQVDSIGDPLPRAIDIPFSDGDVQVDATSRIRRVLRLTVPDPTWMPATADDVLSPYSAKLRVRQGVAYPDGTTEMVPVGVFRVQSVDGDEELGPLEVIGHSLESVVIDDRFESPRQASGASCVALIQTLITESNPDATFIVTATSDQAVPNTIWDEDRWGAVEELATVIGAEVYCNPDGVYVIADVVDPATANPSVYISAGEDGSLKSVARGFSREGVYNSVVVEGQALDPAADPPRAVVRDTDAASPTRWGGPFGKVVRFWRSPLANTVAACEKAARTILLRSLGLARTVTVESLPRPDIDAGQAVRIVTDPVNKPNGEVHVLESFPLRLQVGGRGWVAQTRSTTYSPDGGL